MITEAFLAELERVAKAATPEWKPSGDWFHDHRTGSYLFGHGQNDEQDCDFVAQANPATVLALVSALRTAIGALEFYSSCDYHPADFEGDGNNIVEFGTRANQALAAIREGKVGG